MRMRHLIFVLCCGSLFGCTQVPTDRPFINSGSYDWTDQVRDARGFPLPGWGTAVMGGDGGMSGSANGM
jgi:hypothetical protein